MRLLKEENTESVQENRIYKFIVFLFLCSISLYAQIPINGFCKLHSFHFLKAADSFYPCNFNNDAYTDLMVVDQKDRKVYVLEGMTGNEFKLKSTNELPAGLHKIVLYNAHQMNEFCYIAGKTRKSGMLKINSGGSISYHNILSFDADPGFLNAFDTNRDSIPELLFSGPAMKGITVIKDYSKAAKTVLQGASCYGESAFIDMNSDSYKDFVAYNLFSGKLDCFYNNSRGEYSFVRSLNLPGFVTQIKSFDYNLDGYADISYVIRNQINFIPGDGVASYSLTKTVYLREEPYKYIYGDFNRDGKIDIMYVNKACNKVSVLFQKDNLDFYPEVSYYLGSGITDINPIYSKYLNGAGISQSNGDLTIIESLSLGEDQAEICFGAKNAILQTFDFGNDGLKDIALLDAESHNVTFLTRDKSGIFDKLFVFNLPDVYSEMKIDDSHPYEKTIVCLQKEKQSIDAFTVDFRNGGIKSIYSHHFSHIIDFSISGVSPRLSVLQHLSNTLSIEYYNAFTETKPFLKTSCSVNEVEFAKIIKDNSVLYCDKSNTEYSYKNWIPNAATTTLIDKNTLKKDERIVRNFIGDFFNDLHDRFFVLSEFKNQLHGYLPGSPEFPILDRSDKVFSNTLSDSLVTFYRKRHNGEPGKLFLYDKASRTLYRVDIVRRRGKIYLTEIGNIENVSNFIIEKLSGSRNYIISTSNNKRTTSFEKL